MPARFHPSRGSVVIYVDRHASDGTVFQRSVTVGPEIDDPLTHETWLPAIGPDQMATITPPEP